MAALDARCVLIEKDGWGLEPMQRIKILGLNDKSNNWIGHSIFNHKATTSGFFPFLKLEDNIQVLYDRIQINNIGI